MRPTTGGGLSRFRSAPATWLEALLESEEEAEDVIIDPPKPPLITTQTSLTSIAATTTRTPTTGGYGDPNNSNNMFIPNPISLRQNSSPAEFLSQINNHHDAFISNYSTPSFDDYSLSSSRDVGLDEQRHKFTTQLSGDHSALLDVEMDKFLGDSVPCRVRAKRGCATHPRSIAERVRRTRISDRIRKLQDLVPNMDKQTNTADMLEEAVEYVKFLQKQIQGLREHRDKCTCSVKD